MESITSASFDRLGLASTRKPLVAVSQYKFSPALFDGTPVVVELYVDVNFQISGA